MRPSHVVNVVFLCIFSFLVGAGMTGYLLLGEIQHRTTSVRLEPTTSEPDQFSGDIKSKYGINDPDLRAQFLQLESYAERNAVCSAAGNFALMEPPSSYQPQTYWFDEETGNVSYCIILRSRPYTQLTIYQRYRSGAMVRVTNNDEINRLQPGSQWTTDKVPDEGLARTIRRDALTAVVWNLSRDGQFSHMAEYFHFHLD